jgi:hypothetical protein
MSSRIASTLPAIVLLISASMSSVAAAPLATHACARVVAPTQRLACYDRAFPPAHAVQAEASEQVRTFGLRPRQDPAERIAEDARAKSIASQIVSVGSDRDGERVFTLNNGQVWRQTESSVLGLARTGDAITIRAGSFGSYLLITPGGVPLKVKRIR